MQSLVISALDIYAVHRFAYRKFCMENCLATVEFQHVLKSIALSVESVHTFHLGLALHLVRLDSDQKAVLSKANHHRFTGVCIHCCFDEFRSSLRLDWGL